MDKADGKKLTGGQIEAFQHKREASRHVATAVAASDSPLAMESTLSEIADEVMQEAIERRRLAALGR